MCEAPNLRCVNCRLQEQLFASRGTVGGDDDDSAAAAKARFAAYTARRLAGAASRQPVAPPPPDHLGTALARAHTMTNMAPFPRSDRWLHPASRLR